LIDKSWYIRYDVKTAFGISEKLMISTGWFVREAVCETVRE